MDPQISTPKSAKLRMGAMTSTILSSQSQDVVHVANTLMKAVKRVIPPPTIKYDGASKEQYSSP